MHSTKNAHVGMSIAWEHPNLHALALRDSLQHAGLEALCLHTGLLAEWSLIPGSINLHAVFTRFLVWQA